MTVGLTTQQLELAARIAAAKQQLAVKNSPENNKLLINLYVASSVEMYIAYYKGLQAAITHWGVDAKLEIPKDLPAYYTVCPTCGKTCGELTMIKHHKLLAGDCESCEREFQGKEPIIGTYAIREMAKIMKQPEAAIEHFVCEAMMERRRIKLNASR
jgi:hypothetical protein